MVQPPPMGSARYDFMMRLSVSDRFGALPVPVRSSGTCATPASMASATGRLASSPPLTVMEPAAARAGR